MTVEIKSWDELSILEQYQSTYWDMHKDAYGVRPRCIDTSSWTIEDFEAEFVILGEVIEAEDLVRKEAENTAMFNFEKRVDDLIYAGAKDRATAIRWIHEAEDTGGDDEYLCYTLGLPYGYFRKVA